MWMTYRPMIHPFVSHCSVVRQRLFTELLPVGAPQLLVYEVNEYIAEFVVGFLSKTCCRCRPYILTQRYILLHPCDSKHSKDSVQSDVNFYMTSCADLITCRFSAASKIQSVTFLTREGETFALANSVRIQLRISKMDLIGHIRLANCTYSRA